MKSGFCAESSNDNHHCIAQLADFFSVHYRTSGVAELAFAGRGIDRGCPKKEPDFLRRFVTFALTIKINPGNSAASLAKRDRDKASRLARATELGFVIRGVKFSAVDFEFFADVGAELGVGFDSFDSCLPSSIDSGAHRSWPAAGGKIDIVAGRLSAQHCV